MVFGILREIAVGTRFCDILNDAWTFNLLQLLEFLSCIGQALFEHGVYDQASGQLLSGSFMDYCMPRADNLPNFAIEPHSTTCTHTPMGVKGCGECGTIGSPAAIISAVVDALKPLGVSHVDMPATPNHIWNIIRNSSARVAAE